jgi:hypothetical protein
MNKEHAISDEVLELVQLAISRNENWMVYNNSLYFIDKADVLFFKEQDAAEEFATNNISDYDCFNIIYVQSVADVLRQIPYYERLKVDPDANGLYNMDGNAFTDALIDHIEQQQLLNNSKNNVMNEKNLQYLKDNIKYHGFGETLNPELEKQLTKGDAEFSLAFKTEVGKKEIEATLHFKKSDSTDMYFFNKYDCKTKNESKGESVEQTFYINKGTGVTLKEAYNLLNGRAVYKELINKEDQKYKSWIQLDFSAKDKHGNYERKPYHDKYGYDLKEALSYFPIKEMMKADGMKDLLRSLEKGNLQIVTMELPGKDTKFFIEACPKYKNINVYDNRMIPLKREQKEELMKKPEINDEKSKEQAKNKSNDQTQGLAGEDKDGKKLHKNEKKVNSDDDLEGKLLPKKRTNNNKQGLGV